MSLLFEFSLSSRAQQVFFLFLLIIAILVRLIVVKIHHYWVDEALFIYKTKLLLEGKKLYKDFRSTKPPGIHLLLLPFLFLYYLFHSYPYFDIILYFRLINIIFFVITIFVLIKLMKEIFDKIYLLPLIIYMFDPFFIIYSVLVLVESFSLPIILLMFLFFVKYLKSNSKKYMFCFSFFAVFVLFLKQYFIPYVILCLILIIYYNIKKNNKKSLLVLFFSLILSISVFIVIFYFILDFYWFIYTMINSPLLCLNFGGPPVVNPFKRIVEPNIINSNIFGYLFKILFIFLIFLSILFSYNNKNLFIFGLLLTNLLICAVLYKIFDTVSAHYLYVILGTSLLNFSGGIAIINEKYKKIFAIVFFILFFLYILTVQIKPRKINPLIEESAQIISEINGSCFSFSPFVNIFTNKNCTNYVIYNPPFSPNQTQIVDIISSKKYDGIIIDSILYLGFNKIMFKHTKEYHNLRLKFYFFENRSEIPYFYIMINNYDQEKIIYNKKKIYIFFVKDKTRFVLPRNKTFIKYIVYTKYTKNNTFSVNINLTKLIKKIYRNISEFTVVCIYIHNYDKYTKNIVIKNLTVYFDNYSNILTINNLKEVDIKNGTIDSHYNYLNVTLYRNGKLQFCVDFYDPITYVNYSIYYNYAVIYNSCYNIYILKRK